MMQSTTEYSQAENQSALFAVKTQLVVGLLVFILMIVAGVVLRAAQGSWIEIGPDLFYQLMTLHGAGMVGTAGIAGSVVMWHFLRRQVQLSTAFFWTFFLLCLLGVVLILAAIFIGKFAGGWTFLYPLPAKSMGSWSVLGAALYMFGLLSIGVGFLILYLDVGRGILHRFGNFAKALGLDSLFGSTPVNPDHPLSVVASTMVLIVNVAGIAAGAVVLVMCLVNLYYPAFAPDALLIKNLIFFFGHVFINASIYAAVIVVYELLPHYTGRPWKASKVFFAAWAAVTLMVMAVYPHHLLMDFPMPRWAATMGQIVSYMSGIPVLAVTGFGALTIIYRSGIRWTMAPCMLVLSIFGWSAGVIPAIVDATIQVNLVMHNTLWVPGHFHLYLLLGLLPMVLGFAFYLIDTGEQEIAVVDRLSFLAYAGGGFLFCAVFLASGTASIPRRWAVHYEAWLGHAQLGTVAGVIVLLAILVLGLRILLRLPSAGVPENTG